MIYTVLPQLMRLFCQILLPSFSGLIKNSFFSNSVNRNSAHYAVHSEQPHLEVNRHSTKRAGGGGGWGADMEFVTDSWILYK